MTLKHEMHINIEYLFLQSPSFGQILTKRLISSESSTCRKSGDEIMSGLMALTYINEPITLTYGLLITLWYYLFTIQMFFYINTQCCL